MSSEGRRNQNFDGPVTRHGPCRIEWNATVSRICHYLQDHHNTHEDHHILDLQALWYVSISLFQVSPTPTHERAVTNPSTDLRPPPPTSGRSGCLIRCFRPWTHSTMMYFSAYSNYIDWMTRMLGMTDLGGARSLMFVDDGVTSYTPRHSTWVCIFYAPMALL